MSSSNDKLRESENSKYRAWMVAFCLLGLVSGMFIQQFATMITQGPLLTKIPNAPSNGDTNTTTILTTTPLTTTPIAPDWNWTITHFAFHDTGDNNGGKGSYGVYNPSDENIWYLRWHNIAIEEIGVRAGKLLVTYSFYDIGGSLFSDSRTLEFNKGETKVNLEFMIQITESMAKAESGEPDEINHNTVKIELVGET